MAKGLDERQAKFCGLCAEGIAPEDAARLAGYRKKGVEKTLLASEKIRAGIEAGRQRADGGEESAGKEENHLVGDCAWFVVECHWGWWIYYFIAYCRYAVPVGGTSPDCRDCYSLCLCCVRV